MLLLHRLRRQIGVQGLLLAGSVVGRCTRAVYEEEGPVVVLNCNVFRAPSEALEYGDAPVREVQVVKPHHEYNHMAQSSERSPQTQRFVPLVSDTRRCAVGYQYLPQCLHRRRVLFRLVHRPVLRGLVLVLCEPLDGLKRRPDELVEEHTIHDKQLEAVTLATRQYTSLSHAKGTKQGLQ
jgi:hypothetical protein